MVDLNMGVFSISILFQVYLQFRRMFTYYSNVGAAQVMARIYTGIWDAWCIFSCLMFLTVNNETVTHCLEIIYVAVERANLFCKIAWLYILYYNNVL